MLAELQGSTYWDKTFPTILDPRGGQGGVASPKRQAGYNWLRPGCG